MKKLNFTSRKVLLSRFAHMGLRILFASALLAPYAGCHSYQAGLFSESGLFNHLFGKHRDGHSYFNNDDDRDFFAEGYLPGAPIGWRHGSYYEPSLIPANWKQNPTASNGVVQPQNQPAGRIVTPVNPAAADVARSSSPADFSDAPYVVVTPYEPEPEVLPSGYGLDDESVGYALFLKGRGKAAGQNGQARTLVLDKNQTANVETR